MAILTFEEILAAEDITTEEVPVPEWGGSVMCRSISHRTMRNIKEKVKKGKEDDPEGISDDDVEKYVLIEGMIEPKIDEEKYEKLIDKSTAPINKILMAIMGKSKVTDKAVKEAEKTFPAESE